MSSTRFPAAASLEGAAAGAVVGAALGVPITGKIRIGWEDCKTYKLVARVLEQEGGALVAIHGRTKEQGYRGCWKCRER